ncbi:MAG: molybdopterin molybdotransferase MoeA, partial [Verrucomicrobiae bacterium]|nr:molybdopterin molybdotransferase MoeA [Verrucomicrobiae bacterium]
MIEETEARRRILEAIPLGGGPEETVSLEEALGRVLSREIVGRVDLPGFDNSSMDGYAVRAVEAVAGAKLQIAGEQPAGPDLRLALESGQAIRIFTGAPIPAGADAVIMQEDVRRLADSNRIEIVEGVESGENIRPRGGDVCAGQKLFEAGVVIGPAAIGLLASQGYTEVPVFAKPRVGIVTTGDELREPGQGETSLPQGCLYNSNGPMLAALVRELGARPRRWHAPDEPEALRAMLAEALEASDFLLVAGGVSVGDRDFVKETLAELGVASDFWRVRVKPGKPFLFVWGKQSHGGSPGAFVFGLPGNPVSAF